MATACTPRPQPNRVRRLISLPSGALWRPTARAVMPHTPVNAAETLTLGEDANISCASTRPRRLDADLVFAGYGLAILEADYDDFKGLDVRGKVVVYLAGPPPGIPGPLAAHMQSAHERASVLSRLGAVGTVAIPNPKNMDIPRACSTSRVAQCPR